MNNLVFLTGIASGCAAEEVIAANFRTVNPLTRFRTARKLENWFHDPGSLRLAKEIGAPTAATFWPIWPVGYAELEENGLGDEFGKPLPDELG
ncbi:hypothetical protein [Anaerocaecibacter muris]|uniref:hypothetical protein n=1 Tax=Anaerocaecibacter muris TaxID=2941513 RepID=UPI003F68FD37